MNVLDLNEIVVVTDQSGEVKKVNEKAENYFKQDLIGKKLPEICETEENSDEIILENEGSLKGIKSQTEDGTILIFREDYESEYERSQEKIQEYIYAVSHDFRSPLMTIKSFSTFLDEDYAEELGDEGKDFINRIKQAAIKMEDMIEDLLKLSRIRRTEKSTFDLNKILKSVIKDYENEAEFKVAEMPEINAKKKWIRKLFDNLIENAVKYNKPDKKVEIDFKENDKYKFFVKDNGHGIKEKNKEKVFKLFENTGKENEGKGAGLTICKKIVEDQGGRIWIEPTDNGTTVQFTLSKS